MGVVVQACSTSTVGVEIGGSQGGGQTGLLSDSQASLDYVGGLCHTTQQPTAKRLGFLLAL